VRAKADVAGILSWKSSDNPHAGRRFLQRATQAAIGDASASLLRDWRNQGPAAMDRNGAIGSASGAAHLP